MHSWLLVFSCFSSYLVLLYNWIFLYTSWAKILPHSIRSCKEKCVVLCWSPCYLLIFVLRSLLWRGLDWWSSVLRSSVDLCNFLGGHSGNLSRWWRRGRRAVARTSKQILCVCDWFPFCLFIALHLFLVIYLVCTSLLHPFHSCISRSLLITTRKQLRVSTHNLEESKRRSSRALHGEFGFNSCFEWPFASYIHTCLKNH